MGLDSVELLVAVEKTFNVEIPDREAQKIRTVGEFYDVVWNAIKEKESERCTSAILFYKFRSYFQDKYDIARSDFKPQTELETIIPTDRRKAEWHSVQQDFELKLPQLVLPKWMSEAITYLGAVTIGGGVVVAFLAVGFLNAPKTWWLLPVAGLVLTVLLVQAVRPWKTTIKQKNMREFVESVLALNYKQLSDRFGTNRQEMESVMAIIIHDRTGIDFSRIRPEADIRNDLGID